MCYALSCGYLLYNAIHIDCLPAWLSAPPIATECVDYDLTLLFEFPCQVRRYQPPLENLSVRIDERIGVFLVDFTCTDKFLDHLVLSVKHMQIRNAFCPWLSVHIFRFYIRQREGALIGSSLICGVYKQKTPTDYLLEFQKNMLKMVNLNNSTLLLHFVLFAFLWDKNP